MNSDGETLCVCCTNRYLSVAMSAPRSSVFTFESTAHSTHVLSSLDEQRRRDVLCDVTVVVEGQSFRAHHSVLASCSEYFAQRISSFTQHGAVVTLPQEVRNHVVTPQRSELLHMHKLTITKCFLEVKRERRL